MIITVAEQAYIKGYAQALQDIMLQLTGGNTCGKRYDPCTFDDDTLHSYAFDLKDGGRHHPLSDYSGVDEIISLMLDEAEKYIREGTE